MLQYVKLLMCLKDATTVYRQEKGKYPTIFMSKRFIGAVGALVFGVLLARGIAVENQDSITTIAGMALPFCYFLAMGIKGIVDRVRRGAPVIEAIGQAASDIESALEAGKRENQGGTTMKGLIVFAVALLALFSTVAMADDATTTSEAITTPASSASTSTANSLEGFTGLSLTPNIPTLWLGERGSSAFVATGVGLDLLRYEKTMSYGGTLSASLQAIGASKITGPDAGNAVIGLSAFVDIAKLFTGAKGVTVTDNWSLSVGPAMAWDQVKDRPAFGAGFIFSYKR